MRYYKLLSAVIIIAILLSLTACGPLHKTYVKGYRQSFDDELDAELNHIVEGIMGVETINKIDFFALYKDQRSMCVDLFGTNNIEDVFVICQYINDYLEDNPNSRIITDRIKMRIQLFEKEPSRREAQDLWYLAAISNCDIITNPIESAWNDRFVYLDANLAGDLRTSKFNKCNIPFVKIWLPTNTVIDDYDVFIRMDSLRELEFSDPVWKEDTEASNKKKEEIKYYDKIKNLQFKCYVH